MLRTVALYGSIGNMSRADFNQLEYNFVLRYYPANASLYDVLKPYRTELLEMRNENKVSFR